MRVNGYIQLLIPPTSETNEYGEVVVSEESWSDPIHSHIATNSDTRKGKYEDGVFRQASYTIMCEPMGYDFSRIKITRMGEDLGEHDVLSVEPLSVQGRIKIVV